MLAIVNCRAVVTLDGPRRPRIRDEMRELGVVNEGAVLVDGDRIVAVGTRSEIERRITRGATVLDARRGVVLPGFVDAHTHPVFAGTRVDEFERRARGESYEQIAAAGGGIRSTVAHTRSATDDALVVAGLRYASWFIANGTTTVEAKSGYGLDLETELKILRAIRRVGTESGLTYVPTVLAAHAVPGEFHGRSDAYVDEVAIPTIDAAVHEGLARYADVFCEQGYFDHAQTRRVLVHARSRGLGLRIHADQLRDGDSARLAAELCTDTADHLEHASDAGIAALASAGVQPVLLPASVHCLGKRDQPRARAMIDAGSAMVLATDFNPGSSPTPAMPFVLSLACMQLRMSPAEALVAATVNAAWSVGLGHDRGVIAPGMRADLVVWDVEDPREIAYFVGAPLARAVVCGGRVLRALS